MSSCGSRPSVTPLSSMLAFGVQQGLVGETNAVEESEEGRSAVRIVDDHVVRVVRLVLVDVVERQRRLEGIARREAQRRARADPVLLAPVGAGPVLPAVGLATRGGKEQRQIVTERDVRDDRGAPGVVAAAGELGISAAAAFGSACDQVDRAADVVLAEERALRAAQHFDPLDVGEIQVRAEGARQVHAIDIQADRGIGGQQEVELAHATDECAHLRGRAARARREIQVGCCTLDRGDLTEVVVPQKIAGERRHRDRSLLDVRLHPLRGDDDFLETGRRFLGRRGERGEGGRYPQGNRAAETWITRHRLPRVARTQNSLQRAPRVP